MPRSIAAALGLAAVSLLPVAPAPSYDPWAWLLWGRELAGGELSTVDGPAFKPLPVAVCALLAPLGSAAPWLWVLLVRAAVLLAAAFAFDLGRRLADGSRAAGALAAAGVLLCGGLLGHSATGAEPALVLALALGGAMAWRARRVRLALACGAGCALLRVEAWPFLALAGVLLWRRRPQDRPLLAALLVLVPAAWLVPELIGSGDPLRSGARARVPNPGQPALSDVPALAALDAAIRLPLWPLWAGVAALFALRTRRALAPAAAGAAWIALVAAMAQAGFSGEPRYALPGAALIALSGGVGLVLAVRRARGVAALGGVARPAAAVRRARTASGLGVAVAALLALAAAPRLAGLPALRAEQAYQWRLAGELADAVRAAGGREAVLACGRPYVGPYRGPLMAYRMDVPKHVIEPDAAPRPPGVVFRSARTLSATPAPTPQAAFTEIARTSRWQVLAACERAAGRSCSRIGRVRCSSSAVRRRRSARSRRSLSTARPPRACRSSEQAAQPRDLELQRRAGQQREDLALERLATVHERVEQRRLRGRPSRARPGPASRGWRCVRERRARRPSARHARDATPR